MHRLTKQELHDLKALHRKRGREEQNLFLIEGEKIVLEALVCPYISVKKVLCTENYDPSTLRFEKDTIHVSPSEMARISALKSPQDVVAVCQLPVSNPPSGKRMLCLDGIQDPGNLGSILRIADWFGVPDVVLSSGSVDCFGPKCVQASMGSIFRVKVHYLPLEPFLLKTELPIYGAVLDGTPLKAITWKNEGILVIGGEGSGISIPVHSLLTERVTIPRLGGAESLNAAIACGILCAKWHES